ncbi:MAG: alpha/beta hydrolase [Flavobacterium sp.]
MDFQPMQYVYKSSGKKDAVTLLLLHGTGGNEHDLIPLANYFGSDINVLSLRGNVSENGMSRFFKRLQMGVFDENDLEFRTHEMVSFIKELAVKENFDASKIIALGYSNGANIAGATLFLYPGFFAGAILFRPMLPFQSRAIKEKTTARVFLSSGTNDTMVSETEIENYVDQLTAAGFWVTNLTLDAGHNLTQKDIDLAVEWFENANTNS